MAERHDVTVIAEDGTELAGWWYPAAGAGRRPAVLLSHGLSAIKAMGLAGYAERFQAAGLSCLVYDHRGYAGSGGTPRHESDPWKQVHDMRDAISWLRLHPEVDPERIGIWGTSFSGGHVLTVAALDRRVKAVVSQVPFVRGEDTFDAWVPAERRAGFEQRMMADRDDRAGGAAPLTTKAAVAGSETAEWAEATDLDGSYANELTIRTFELLREYEPYTFVPRIAPTPLLMVIATNDTQTPTAWQRAAYATAGEPKRLVELECRHYDPYTTYLEQSAGAARDWFVEHLRP
ncbi:MAG: alpha/beta fold hydrolase [Acidimicrobiales bacterium]|nr:alpha/beta fold hydrolase [Acidimicrobiales bacterium]